MGADGRADELSRDACMHGCRICKHRRPANLLITRDDLRALHAFELLRLRRVELLEFCE